MEVLHWNCNGLIESRLKQLKSLVDTREELQMVSLSETKRDLRREENIVNLSVIFPSQKWKKCYTFEGQGLITFVKYPTDTDYDIEIEDHSVEDRELMHVVKIKKSNNQNYTVFSFAHVFYLVFSCSCPCAHDMKCRVMCIPA